jgi:diguanylate cyclase (GGDEF)-like protein
VGKTTVIDQLRPLVSADDGWLVAGKYDEHRRDRGADGVWQALRGLGRLLLAEPDTALASACRRLSDQLGTNAGLLATVVPEIAMLLQVRPESLPAGEGGEVERQLARATVDAVAAVAAQRPLVMVVDDLQWAGNTAISVVDRLVTERPAGVLVVGAYRDDEVDPLHPLSAAVSRWQRSPHAPRSLALRNLPPADVGTLLTEMLRLDPGDARRLADTVTARTGGNPFDTIELVNALRRDRVLTPAGDRWEWDDSAIRLYVGAGDVIDLLTARIERLPAPARALLELLACLGDQLDMPLLTTASGWPAEEIQERLAPALEDGLLVLQSGGAEPAVAFRHDRVRQAARGEHADEARLDLHHTLAQRLATRPELTAMAAEQYLAAMARLADPAERLTAVDVFRTAAGSVRLTEPAMAEQFLAAATRLAQEATDQAARGAAPAGTLLTELRTEHHAVLCGLGRFAEADDVYAAIERRNPTPLELSAAATARIASLPARNRQQDAVDLGVTLLARLGTAVPSPAALPDEIGRGIEALHRWLRTTGPEDDLRRPEVTDPTVLARARIIENILPAAYISGQPVFGWLVNEAQRMWAEHGPCAALVAPLSHTGFMTIMLQQDYRTGYEVARRVLAVAEARAYQPQTAHARFLFALGHGPWFEPITSQAELAREAREDFQRHGDSLVCLTYFATLPPLLDCAPTVEAFSAEVDAALAAAHRTGDMHSAAAFVGYRQLVRALRGETSAPGSLTDSSGDITAHLAGLATSPTIAANVYTVAAVAAVIFNDVPSLVEHSAAAMPLLPFINATYLTATTHLVRALALADQLSAADAEDPASLRAELDSCRDWFARRAADAPMNFDHLLHLLDAESRWLDGDGWAAASRFDAAIAAAAEQPRAWHQAMIAERASRFYLAQGLAQVGRSLLGQARSHYLHWGAAAKVAQLDRQHPARAAVGEARNTVPETSNVSTRDTSVDILAVLDASRALSSATNLDALHKRLADVLGAMTGATGIGLLRWAGDAQEWVLPPTQAGNGQPLMVHDPAAADRVPVSVVRYVQRTCEPLLLHDAVGDDRFAKDPYLKGLDACSMMVVPIQSRGAPLALLLLDKPHTRGAFTAAGLDTVTLVAGQLAVSIENATVYASLERKVDERTLALSAANERLQELSRTDPLTGLANRRRLEEALAGEWRRALGTQTPIAVLMIDIDHFKPYNDEHGHLAGDRCLQQVARALADSVDAPALVVRYGGEEFAVVLPGAGLDAACQVAERSRLSVTALREEHSCSSTGFVTASIGVASVVPTAGSSPQTLVEDADKGLYEAKRHGRNRIAVAHR